MKKNIIKTLCLLTVAVMMASCNNQPSKDAAGGDNGTLPEKGMIIAYIELDSLTEHYEYAKIMKDSLEKMSANATKRLSDMDKALERSYNSIQTRLQNNSFTSEQQYKTAVAAFEQERNNRVALEGRLTNELAQMQTDFLNTLQDSLDNFLADYNKDKKFDMILNKATVLYSDKKYDITQDVINGMNARFKKVEAKSDK